MSENYMPGPAYAQVEKTPGDSWRLVLIRNLRHAPDKVWKALTQPEHLRQWAPFEADIGMDKTGATIKLTTVGAPGPHITETKIVRADAPRTLEYTWGANEMRWELEATDAGTKLTLWTSIDRRYIAMGASGWQICLDVLDHWLAETPIGRMAGPETMKFEGWQRLHAEYAKLFS